MRRDQYDKHLNILLIIEFSLMYGQEIVMIVINPIICLLAIINNKGNKFGIF